MNVLLTLGLLAVPGVVCSLALLALIRAGAKDDRDLALARHAAAAGVSAAVDADKADR